MSEVTRTVTQQTNLIRQRFARDVIPALTLLVLIIGGWEVLTIVLGVHPVILPSPSRIVQTIGNDWHLLYTNMLFTLWEVLLGFGIGFTVGLILAILIVYSPILERARYPLVVAS